MTYIEGFVAAVPKANRETYLKHAADAAPMIQEFGAARMVETWEDDIQDGKLNDLRTAVKARPDEAIVFSWFEYPSKAVRDAANEQISTDPRMKTMGESMPFDGMRMIYGGFASLYDEHSGGETGYVDGCLIPVPTDNKDPFREFARLSANIFMDHGATRVIDCWGDDLPDGKITDFKGAVLAEPGETVDFGWVEWPSKAARDIAWEKVMEDERMNALKPPFDGKRMIFGGFTPILDSKVQAASG